MTTLHDLYKQHDRISDDLDKITRQIYLDNPDNEDRIKEIKTNKERQAFIKQLKDLNKEIMDIGQQDFEADFQKALVRELESNPHEVWGAITNVIWEHNDGSRYSCSFRYAGDLIARCRNRRENYLDFYCVGYPGQVNEKISNLMKEYGWNHKAY